MLPNMDDDLQIFFQMNYDILLMYKSVEVDIRMNYVSLSMCKKHESWHPYELGDVCEEPCHGL